MNAQDNSSPRFFNGKAECKYRWIAHRVCDVDEGQSLRLIMDRADGEGGLIYIGLSSSVSDATGYPMRPGSIFTIQKSAEFVTVWMYTMNESETLVVGNSTLRYIVTTEK